jgi:Fic family protein
MGFLLPDTIPISTEMLRLISEVDRFRGGWDAALPLAPERLAGLRRVATIESVGSSTRIEGAKLSNAQVDALLGNLSRQSFSTRDEQEVAGYAFVLEQVFAFADSIPLTAGSVRQLHRDLLQYSTKDERHRGDWKTHPNLVAAFDAEGKQVGILFQTSSPFETPQHMEALLDWHRRAEHDSGLHPLLRVGIFVVMFLAIHPFQDGNGRLSRVLTMLLLLRAGYSYAPYSSLESLIEQSKEAYYLALRRTQTSWQQGQPDWDAWLVFFLRTLHRQTQVLQQRVAGQKPAAGGSVVLSPEARKVLSLFDGRETLTTRVTVEITGIALSTVKVRLKELLAAGVIEAYGRGKATFYRRR